MKLIFGIFIALLCTTSFAVDTKVNTKIYLEQGGAVQNVKTGGLLKIRDTNQSQIRIPVVGIDGAVVGYGVAPHAGTIDSISCIVSDEIDDTPTTLTAAINGTNITNGVVTVSTSGTSLNARFTASPSAAKTVVAGDLISVTSNGGTNTSSNAGCLLYVTP